MGDGNLLSLRWNNHISNFKFTLGQLQQRDLYSDALIACEGRFFPVHKFVLSTCSDYFASMFERTPCKHPVIVLKDVSVRDIEFLLSYMYGGEVSVGQTDLPSLIRAAETLNIKGLAAHDEPPSSPRGLKTMAMSGGKDTDGNRSKRPRLESTSLQDNIQSTDDIKKEVEEDYTSLSETESDAKSKNKDEAINSLSFGNTDVNQVNTNDSNFYEDANFPELQVKQENMEGISVGESSNSREEGTGFPSSRQNSSLPTPDAEPISWPSSFIPGSVSSSALNNGLSSSSLSHRSNPLYPPRHSSDASDVGSSPSGGGRCAPLSVSSHPCPMCPKRFQSRADVIRHMRTHTGEKPFKCPHCDYRAALKGNLKSHVLSRHGHLQGFP